MGDTPQPAPAPPHAPNQPSAPATPHPTPDPSPGPRFSSDPLQIGLGESLHSGRRLESIAGDLDTIATALKTMRGQGSMHPTAAAAFDLMLNAQVSHATDLAKFTKLDADTVRHTVTITEWADEQSVVNGPGWRPGKPARFLDGN